MDAFPHITPESLYAARIERRVSAALSPDNPKAHWEVVPAREITDTAERLVEAIEDVTSYKTALKTVRDIISAGRGDCVQGLLAELALKGSSIVGAPQAAMNGVGLH